MNIPRDFEQLTLALEANLIHVYQKKEFAESVCIKGSALISYYFKWAEDFECVFIANISKHYISPQIHTVAEAEAKWPDSFLKKKANTKKLILVMRMSSFGGIVDCSTSPTVLLSCDFFLFHLFKAWSDAFDDKFEKCLFWRRHSHISISNTRTSSFSKGL